MMKKLMIAMLAILSLSRASTVHGEGVLGVLGMNPVTDNSYMAAWIPLAEGEGLIGIEWFNNDGTSAFQSVLLAAGNDTDPGFINDGTPVMAAVYGCNSGWSRIDWSNTYAGQSGGVFVVFHLPYGSVFVSQGTGGGSAIGYIDSESGAKGWMTADGSDWCSLHPSFGFAVRAIKGSVDASTVMLTSVDKAIVSSRDLGELMSPTTTHLVTALGAPAPNPFNPQTQLHFTLASAERIDLSLYDLRGGLVISLASGMYSVGDHLVVWDGQDDRGRAVPSGTYLAYLRAGSFVQTQRLLLLR